MTKNMVFLGPQGSGKGTVISKIKDNLGVPHISTGDMFRAALKEGTEFGQKAKEYMNKGELVPDDLLVGLVDLDHLLYTSGDVVGEEILYGLDSHRMPLQNIFGR